MPTIVHTSTAMKIRIPEGTLLELEMGGVGEAWMISSPRHLLIVWGCPAILEIKIDGSSEAERT